MVASCVLCTSILHGATACPHFLSYFVSMARRHFACRLQSTSYIQPPRFSIFDFYGLHQARTWRAHGTGARSDRTRTSQDYGREPRVFVLRTSTSSLLLPFFQRRRDGMEWVSRKLTGANRSKRAGRKDGQRNGREKTEEQSGKSRK